MSHPLIQKYKEYWSMEGTMLLPYRPDYNYSPEEQAASRATVLALLDLLEQNLET